MAEYTDFENKYRSYTGFTYDGIKAFDKLEKNEKLADKIQWYVPGGAGIKSRDEFVATVKEHFGKAQTVEDPEPGPKQDNPGEQEKEEPTDTKQENTEEQKEEEPTGTKQENTKESSTAEVKE